MKLKPYPDYKDSGVEWIGEIPEGWEIVPLNKFTNLVTDYVANGSFSSIKANVKYKDDEDYAILIRLVDFTKKFKGPFVYIDEHSYQFLSKTKLNSGDIILSNVGAVGTVFKVPNLDKPMSLAPNVLLIRVYNKISSDYLYYWLKSDIGQFSIKRIVTETSQPKFNKTNFRKVPILSPLINEQEEMIKFIDNKTSDINLTIERDLRLIELLKEKRTALINHVVTKGLDPTAEMKDSGVEWIGEIPEDWEVLPLFDLFKERKMKNIRNREDNVLSLSYGRIIRRNVETNFGLLPESFTTYNIVEPGCIVLRLTDLQNDKKSLRTGLVKERGIITSAYLSLEQKKSFNVNYIHYLLHAYDLVKVFYNMGGGVRQTMRFEDMKRMPILYPPLDEQHKISRFIDNKIEILENFIFKITEHIKLLEEYKKSLIHHVVTGKVDVREVAV